MAIQGQEQDPDHVAMFDSEGRRLEITKEEIHDYFLSSTAIDRQADTITWVKNQFISFFGIENLGPDVLFFDFNIDNGSPTFFQNGNPV